MRSHKKDKRSEASARSFRSATVVLLILLLVVAGCGGTNSSAVEDPASNICSELDELDAALDRIDGDSPEEFRTTFNEAQEEYAEWAAVARDQYPEEVEGFDQALNEFEDELLNSEGEGLISGILELANAAAELAAQGDRLDDTIDCPNT